MVDLCTCGDVAGRRNHFDIDYHCRNRDHERCDGNLNTATSYHWWCACKCHPELKQFEPRSHDSQRAYDTWKEARRRMSAPPRKSVAIDILKKRLEDEQRLLEEVKKDITTEQNRMDGLKMTHDMRQMWVNDLKNAIMLLEGYEE